MHKYVNKIKKSEWDKSGTAYWSTVNVSDLTWTDERFNDCSMSIKTLSRFKAGTLYLLCLSSPKFGIFFFWKVLSPRYLVSDLNHFLL